MVAFCLVLAVVATAVGVPLARHDEDRAIETPQAGRSTWTEVLADLDVRRNSALAAGDRRALRAVDVPGGPAERADRAAMTALARAGLRPSGLALVTATVGVLDATAQRVRLGVVDRRSAYSLVDSAGVVVERVPARGPKGWTVELERFGTRWRTASVTPRR